jgi:hypothetical protein
VGLVRVSPAEEDLQGRGRPWSLGRYRGLSLCRSVCAVTVAGDGAYQKTPTIPPRLRWPDKPEHNLVHHCFASERRRHWASLQALGTIRCRPPAGRAVIGFLRASAALGQCEVLARQNLAGRLSEKGRAARRPTRKSAPLACPGCQIAPVACAESGRGLPLFRSFAGGKGGSLAGRVFEGTSPPPCGVLPRKSETRRAKSPLKDSGRPGERCSCYGEYKPV